MGSRGGIVVIVVGELVVRNLVGAVVCDLIEGVVVGLVVDEVVG